MLHLFVKNHCKLSVGVGMKHSKLSLLRLQVIVSMSFVNCYLVPGVIFHWNDIFLVYRKVCEFLRGLKQATNSGSVRQSVHCYHSAAAIGFCLDILLSFSRICTK